MLDERSGEAHFTRMDTSLFQRGDRPPALASSLAGYVLALLMVAGATLLCLLVSSRFGNSAVVMLYLPPVLAAAIYAGLRPALLAAFASTLAYNYYFTAPFRTFAINSPADVVTVLTLLLVAVVSSQLAASVRTQAQLAASHAARNATIAGFARRLLAATKEQDVARETVNEIARIFACHAVLLTGAEAPEVTVATSDGTALNPSDFAAAAAAFKSGRVSGRGQALVRESDWQFHPITPQGEPIAVIGLAREDGVQPVAKDQMQLMESLLDQAALALERARLDRDAHEAAALRELDRLRSALLVSIGDDVKPRLNAIQSNLRALRRDGAANRAIVAELTEEVTKVDRYIDSLVDLGPGADQAPLRFGDISVDLHHRSVLKKGEEVHLTPKEFAVLSELAKHAGRVLSHRHLLRAVWGPAQQEHIDYLRVAVRSLRQKLEADPADPVLIINEPSVGYRLISSKA